MQIEQHESSQMVFSVPILDAAFPMPHLSLGADAILFAHLEEVGLCAKSRPVWRVEHAKQLLVCELKVVKAPAETELTGAREIKDVQCPSCAFEFGIF